MGELRYCPQCLTRNLIYLPWLGQVWECKNCGYRGPVFIEMTEKALWSLLKKIPKGKVTTYKILAEKLNISSRVIGQILRKNKDLNKNPCFKVIHSDGRIGGYVLGQKKKISLLKKEGIIVKDGKLDLRKYLYNYQ